MDNDQLEDLKRFIAASVSQSKGRLRSEMGLMREDMNQGFQAIREEMHQEFQTVRQEMADGFRGVSEAIDIIHKQLDEQKEINARVDKRLTKLERQVAS